VDNTVTVSDADAGTSEVPAVISASDCGPGGGYYAVTQNAVLVDRDYEEYLTESLTFTLCPASCAEHLQSPPEIFTLERGPCWFSIQ
jgi:hypothetical protein